MVETSKHDDLFLFLVQIWHRAKVSDVCPCVFRLKKSLNMTTYTQKALTSFCYHPRRVSPNLLAILSGKLDEQGLNMMSWCNTDTKQVRCVYRCSKRVEINGAAATTVNYINLTTITISDCFISFEFHAGTVLSFCSNICFVIFFVCLSSHMWELCLLRVENHTFKESTQIHTNAITRVGQRRLNCFVNQFVAFEVVMNILF